MQAPASSCLIRPRRTPAVLFVSFALASIFGLLVAGCGGSQSVSIAPAHRVTSSDVSSPPPSPPTSAAEASEVPATKDIGTVSYRGAGTTLRAQFSLGQLAYGAAAAPPADLLDACDLNNSSTIAASGFVPGEMTMSYTRGTLPLTINFEQVGSGNIGANSPPVPQVVLAINDNGRWDCGAAAQNGTTYQPLTFAVAQTATYPIWLVALNAISNAQPTLSQQVLNVMPLSTVPVIAGNTEIVATVSGPTAATCDSQSDGVRHWLLPFAQLPFRQAGGYLNPLSCHPGSGRLEG